MHAKWKSHFRTKSVGSNPLSTSPTSNTSFSCRPRSNTLPSIMYTPSDAYTGEKVERVDEDVDEEQIDKFATNILSIVNSLQKYEYEVSWNI
ncbi:hypothetical protein CLIB1423_07S05226 [[Candida] railenensis]|uniref:Uncharacterized protein n=1 Tax=[Candida] railenensis TaxID=45579 RepID=A0A9P0QPV6_9ASCO|nr:hypothetical protein CLIB1423_07S05226 [[Candida] railenensis]